jgi:hypothetical protein
VLELGILANMSSLRKLISIEKVDTILAKERSNHAFL